MSIDHVIQIQTDNIPWDSSESSGVFYKSLRYDKETKAGAVLIRMEPGSDYPEHEHTQGEDFIVLEGELIIGNEKFPALSYVYSPPKSVHHPRTEKGCTLFAVFHGKIINHK